MLTWFRVFAFPAFIQSDTILEVLHFGEGSVLQVRIFVSAPVEHESTHRHVELNPSN